jgi:hypothetical protein
MMMGDTHRAQRAAARGIELAGSEANALGLLGLKGDSLSQRAENNVLVNKNEIRALLKNAAASVPGTSAKKPVGTTAPTAKGKSATAWRPAGPRAADQSDAASVLYWKH